MHFSSSGGLSPSNREGIDPIAELLSQLSGVRRSGGGSGQSTSAPTQLQQLQMQLQLERQQVRVKFIFLFKKNYIFYYIYIIFIKFCIMSVSCMSLCLKNSSRVVFNYLY